METVLETMSETSEHWLVCAKYSLDPLRVCRLDRLRRSVPVQRLRGDQKAGLGVLEWTWLRLCCSCCEIEVFVSAEGREGRCGQCQHSGHTTSRSRFNRLGQPSSTLATRHDIVRLVSACGAWQQDEGKNDDQENNKCHMLERLSSKYCLTLPFKCPRWPAGAPQAQSSAAHCHTRRSPCE